jgi:hypothetical protein
MGLILPILFLGLMASLSPATIVVFVLVLGTARARMNAVGFLLGWGLSLTIVFLGSYAMAVSGVVEGSSGRASVAVIEVLLGLTVLVAAARLWGRRHAPTAATETGSGSRWGAASLTARMEGLTPFGAAVVGVLKQPWAITTAAALVVVHKETSGLVVALAFGFFTVASTATVGLMFLYYDRHPGDAQTQLAALRDRTAAAGPAVGAAVGMLVGGFLMIDGLLGLT